MPVIKMFLFNYTPFPQTFSKVFFYVKLVQIVYRERGDCSLKKQIL